MPASEPAPAFLTIQRLSARYPGQPQPAVNAVSLSLGAGEIGALIGPSGCGKTTLLRAVAGLERAEAGRIVLGRETVSDQQRHTPVERRRIGMVFQDYALFPHLSVRGNIAFGLGKLLAHARQCQQVFGVLLCLAFGNAHLLLQISVSEVAAGELSGLDLVLGILVLSTMSESAHNLGHLFSIGCGAGKFARVFVEQFQPCPDIGNVPWGGLFSRDAKALAEHPCGNVGAQGFAGMALGPDGVLQLAIQS